jgi:hypothetical protein
MGNFGHAGIGRGWADLRLFWRGRKHHFFPATTEHTIARVNYLFRKPMVADKFWDEGQNVVTWRLRLFIWYH